MNEIRTILLLVLGCAIGFGAGEYHGRAFVYEKFVSPEVIKAAAIAERLETLVGEND